MAFAKRPYDKVFMHMRIFPLRKSDFFVASAIFFSIIFCMCSPAAKKECPTGTPQPMFSESIEGITNYNFVIQGQESIERFEYRQTPILIEQSGCETIRQVFNFRMPKNLNASQVGTAMTRAFQDFAQLGTAQAGFLAWAQAIETQLPEIKFSESFSPSPGIQITLDRIQQVEFDLILLRLEMSQN